MYYESNNYLQHFGVKGMKWGVRRYQNKDGTLTPNGKKHYRSWTTNQNDLEVHDDYARRHSKKSISQMSDAELQDRINRMQLERQYSQLDDYSKKGKLQVDKIVKAGTTIATLSGTAITIYNNIDKIKKIVDGLKGSSNAI